MQERQEGQANRKNRRLQKWSNHGRSIKKWLKDVNDYTCTDGKYTKKYLTTEEWIQIFFILINMKLANYWYHKKMFISNKTILEIMQKYNVGKITNVYLRDSNGLVLDENGKKIIVRQERKKITKEGIIYALKVMVELGFIELVYGNPNDKKSHKIPEGIRKADFIYRQIKFNWKPIYGFCSCYSTDSQFYQNTKSKSRMRKIIQKRPLSYTDPATMSKIFQKYKEESKIKYASEDNMLIGFIASVNKYYDSSALTKNHKSNQPINQQEQEDGQALLMYPKPPSPPPEEQLSSRDNQALDELLMMINKR